MATHSLTLHEAANRLGVHYMTAYRYVRTGRLPAVRVDGQWRIDPADLRAVVSTAATPGRRNAQRGRTPRADLSRRLAGRLVAGDEPGSWTVVEAALAGGSTPEEVMVGVISAAMRRIGESWRAGDLTVDDEHRATSVVMRLVGRLGPLFLPRGPKLGTVVLGAPPHERHGLPTALATNVLRGRGFEVVDLGADVPVDAFGAAVAKASAPVVAAIGVTTGGHDRAVRAIVRTIRERTPGTPVLVGGASVADPVHAARLGAQWGGVDAPSLAETVETVFRQRHQPHQTAAPFPAR